MDQWTLSSFIFAFFLLGFRDVIRLRSERLPSPLLQVPRLQARGRRGGCSSRGQTISWAVFFKEHPGEPQLFSFFFLFASFNPPSPRSSRGGPADSWPAALLSARLFLVARSHLPASDTAASQVISLLFTLSSQSHTGGRAVTSPASWLFFFRIKPKGEGALSAGIHKTSEAEALIYLSVISFCPLPIPSACLLPVGAVTRLLMCI